MHERNYDSLLATISEALRERSPRSAELDLEARRRLVDGGSHALRLMGPFPPRIVEAKGAWLRDEDGHDILDFWQGHLANVLGHNPEVVTAELARAFARGHGLQWGQADRLQAEVAEIVCSRTGAERVRFTTSGSLGNLYAVMLSMSFTGRDHVMKVGGGWHGGHPYGLKGVHYRNGFDHAESEGIPSEILERIVVTRFNDAERLSEDFERWGDRLACFTVEPVVGAGGLIPATREYLETARTLADRHGVVLILDEVITGFRFRAGDAGTLYGVHPDLTILGKVIGGGMPVAAVAGREAILSLAAQGTGRVAFSGGTYSAHPSSFIAAKTMMSYLVEHETEVYPRLAALGDAMRTAIETAFAEEGIVARCTGGAEDVLGGSSLGFAHFPYDAETIIDSPDVAMDPAKCDHRLSSQVLEASLLLDDVQLIHGHGAISTAHTGEDVAKLAEACRTTAKRITEALSSRPR